MRLLHSSFLGCRRHFSLSTPLFSAQIKPTPPLYSTINSAQNDHKILQKHSHHSKNSADPVQYLHSFITLVKTISKNPRNYSALNTLDSLLSQTQFVDSSTSVIIIDYLSQIKKLGRAKNVLVDLKTKRKVSDFFLYSLATDFLLENGTIDDVEIVWKEICGSNPKIDISDYVIYLCKFGGVCEIKSICERILKGGRVLEKQSYLALIGALCSRNEGLFVKKVLKEMHDKRLKVDDLTYYIVFQCFCRNGEIYEADLILRKLVKRKFHIDICIYGNFLFALCKSGKFREANKLFHRLIKRDFVGEDKKVEFLKEGRRAIFQLNCEGNVPEIMAYESYFRTLCNVGRLDEAEVLLKKMMKNRTVPEICVYGSFIKALFLAARDDDAIRFFNVERKKGFIRVDEIARYVIVGLCQKGKLDKAVRIFNEIAATGGFANCANVSNCILGRYWTEGRVAEVEGFFARIKKDGDHGLPDVLTYRIMVNGYCNQGNIFNALNVFDEMVERKIVVDGKLYGTIIRGLCACGRLKEALKYLNDMVESGNMVSGMRWKTLFYSTFAALEHGISNGV